MEHKEIGRGCIPSIEFEGPFCYFWGMEDVPFEALTKGIAESDVL